jgi:hypothetical protein
MYNFEDQSSGEEVDEDCKLLRCGVCAKELTKLKTKCTQCPKDVHLSCGHGSEDEPGKCYTCLEQDKCFSCEVKVTGTKKKCGTCNREGCTKCVTRAGRLYTCSKCAMTVEAAVSTADGKDSRRRRRQARNGEDADVSFLFRLYVILLFLFFFFFLVVYTMSCYCMICR